MQNCSKLVGRIHISRTLQCAFANAIRWVRHRDMHCRETDEFLKMAIFLLKMCLELSPDNNLFYRDPVLKRELPWKTFLSSNRNWKVWFVFLTCLYCWSSSIKYLIFLKFQSYVQRLELSKLWIRNFLTSYSEKKISIYWYGSFRYETMTECTAWCRLSHFYKFSLICWKHFPMSVSLLLWWLENGAYLWQGPVSLEKMLERSPWGLTGVAGTGIDRGWICKHLQLGTHDVNENIDWSRYWRKLLVSVVFWSITFAHLFFCMWTLSDLTELMLFLINVVGSNWSLKDEDSAFNNVETICLVSTGMDLRDCIWKKFETLLAEKCPWAGIPATNTASREGSRKAKNFVAN